MSAYTPHKAPSRGQSNDPNGTNQLTYSPKALEILNYGRHSNTHNQTSKSTMQQPLSWQVNSSPKPSNSLPLRPRNINPYVEEERRKREREQQIQRQEWRRAEAAAQNLPKRPLAETIALWKQNKALKDAEFAARARVSPSPTTNDLGSKDLLQGAVEDPDSKSESEARLKQHKYFKNILNF